MTWPGYPAGRACDGRNEADFFAEVFNLPLPTPFLELKNDSESLLGVNFGRGGGSITYAFGYTTLDTQVDQLETLFEKNVLTKSHLSNSVTLINTGVNDYSSRNINESFQVSPYSDELKSLVANVVDGISFNIMRLHGFGMNNFVVANLPNMPCSPFITAQSNFSACSDNSTIIAENSIHNELLIKRMDLLKNQLGVRILILDQTKAFDHVFHNGGDFGFTETLKPCCYNKDPLDSSQHCGSTDSGGHRTYTLCEDPSKYLIFDGIHPTQAGWKVIFNLYKYDTRFTIGALNIYEWINTYEL
ncbi:hypothetical protein M758_3G241500 [Ceratodon purpureus]|nr:hypothetical protein M758_3G241500 [Ceratodon purpureus]